MVDGMRYFTPRLFKFLSDLEVNNEREWFKANQAVYEAHVREPALRFIADVAKPLGRISPHFVADPSKVGGSLFRIQRDTRFGEDKTPYKTNTGMHFRHEAAKDVHAPGFYLNIEPGGCFMGVGLWRPHTPVAYAIRGHIDENRAAWKRAAHSARFKDVFDVEGESLVRPPKGFPEDHPLIEDLKRKDFIATARLTQKTITSDTLMDEFAGNCKRASAYMKFLCDAVGVPF